MSQKDRDKWNKKYLENPNLLQRREPVEFVKKYANYKEELAKNVLDLACGSGRNSLYLAEIGCMVDSVDISEEALSSFVHKNINKILSDLDNFCTDKKYDLIIMSNFLDRDLIKRSRSWLNRGGLYIVETYLNDKDNEKQHSSSKFLLEPQELIQCFDTEFEILEYKEFFNDSQELYKMKKGAIAAKYI